MFCDEERVIAYLMLKKNNLLIPNIYSTSA